MICDRLCKDSHCLDILQNFTYMARISFKGWGSICLPLALTCPLGVLVRKLFVQTSLAPHSSYID